MEPLEEIKLKDIEDSVILLNIHVSYGKKPNADEKEVLDMAKEGWTLSKMGKNKDSAKYALAIYHNVVKGVFVIKGKWEKLTYDHTRWTFDGEIASAETRERYLGKKIVVGWEEGKKTPFMYINCNPDSSKYTIL